MHWWQKTADRIVFFLLRYVARYRIHIIRENLRGSFDYQSDQALEKDVKQFYQFFAGFLRQALSNPSEKTIREKINFPESPLINQWLAEGQSVIFMCGHLGNWEWFGYGAGLQYKGRVATIYKRIKTPWLNRLMMRRRSRYIPFVFELNETNELIRLIRKQPVIIGMIADQNPHSARSIIWARFLRRDTAFINGPENLALRYKMPIVYYHTKPRPDGGYDLETCIIYDGNESVEEGEITQRFATQLEKNIEAYRPYWLWSHKRWKRIRQETEPTVS